MKKIIAIVLLVLMLTGCAANNGTVPTDSTVNSTAASTTTSVAETTEATEATEPTTEPTEATEATDTTQAEEVETPNPYAYTCGGHDSDPYVDVDVDEFYANYTTACCYQDACYRTEHYLMSGYLELPETVPTTADDQLMDGDNYVRNTTTLYMDDGNTYILLDSQGQFVTYIFKGAAYITLEEVAAYVYAFGGSSANIPANYVVSTKNKTSSTSPWGKYLRLNHGNFTGDTSKYSYEPELPNITGCGGSLYYYEMDIGTYGYNNGSSISRGTCRIVYGRYDLNGNGVIDNDEVFVFYTYNHYNDFQEYLNYYNGWGQRFGNESNGGVYNKGSNPSPYPSVTYIPFAQFFDLL